MLILRLKRIGKKHQAAFRVVVGERRSKLKGDYTEDIGAYNPKTKKLDVKADRVKHWLSVGAKMSDTVNNLLVKNKVIEGSIVSNHKQPAKKEGDAKAAAPAAAPAPAAEAKAA